MVAPGCVLKPQPHSGSPLGQLYLWIAQTERHCENLNFLSRGRQLNVCFPPMPYSDDGGFTRCLMRYRTDGGDSAPSVLRVIGLDVFIKVRNERVD